MSRGGYVKKKTAILLSAWVLVLVVFVLGQLIPEVLWDQSPYLQLVHVFDINAESQFSDPFKLEEDPMSNSKAFLSVPDGKPLEALPQDPACTARLKTLYAYDSFEETLRPIWFREMGNNKYSGTISDDYALDGKTSLRVELRKSDVNINNSKRSELALKKSEVPNASHTYGVAILLPSGGEEDYALDVKGSEIILQWHNVPDEGEQWTTPPLALRTYNGRYVLERCWDDDPISTDASMSSKNNRATYDLGSYIQDKGRFVQWQFHIKWGWLSKQDPILEIVKDGVEVLNLNGLPNTTNDTRGVVLKMGLYKWDWSQAHTGSTLDKRVIYYDRLIIE